MHQIRLAFEAVGSQTLKGLSFDEAANVAEIAPSAIVLLSTMFYPHALNAALRQLQIHRYDAIAALTTA